MPLFGLDSLEEEDVPTLEEAEELADSMAIDDVNNMIANKGVWYFLKKIDKNSFMQIYYAMTDKDWNVDQV